MKFLGSSLTHKGQTVWTAGNDGPSSGLNADSLDGLSSSEFARVSHYHAYVPLSGGTMTGVLHFNRTGQAINIGGTVLDGSDASIRIGNPTYYFDLVYTGSETGNANSFELRSATKTAFRVQQDGIVNARIGLQVNGTDVALSTHTHDSAYLGITAKAADADKLDGHDASYFAAAHDHPYLSSSHDASAVTASKLSAWDTTASRVDQDLKTSAQPTFTRVSVAGKFEMGYDETTECLQFNWVG